MFHIDNNSIIHKKYNKGDNDKANCYNAICWCIFNDTYSLSALCSANYRDCCGYWVGGNDRDVEGTFVWTSDNIALGFVNWHPDQPNNLYSNEDCLSLCRDKRWNDGNCDRYFPYICKSPVL